MVKAGDNQRVQGSARAFPGQNGILMDLVGYIPTRGCSDVKRGLQRLLRRYEQRESYK